MHAAWALFNRPTMCLRSVNLALGEISTLYVDVDHHPRRLPLCANIATYSAPVRRRLRERRDSYSVAIVWTVADVVSRLEIFKEVARKSER